MTIVRSVLTNTAARSATELINRAGSAIFWIVLARYLGLSGLGSFAFGLSLFSLFTAVSTLGLNSVVVRDVARDHSLAPKYFGHSLIMGSIVSAIMAIVMVIIALVLNPNDESLTVSFWLAVALIPSAGFYWSRSLLTATEKMVYIALARAAENIFKIVFGIAIMIAGYGVREVAIVIMLSKVVSFFFAFHFAYQRVAPPAWKLERPFLGYLVRQAPSFFFISVFNGLFWSITVIMMTKIRGEAEAGIFSAALKVVDICISVAAAYGQALFPVSSRTLYNDPQVFAQLFKKSIKYLLLMTIAMAATMTIMAPNAILFLYGSEMRESIPVLQTLIWLLVPYSLVPVYAYTLINSNRPNRDLAANFAASLTLFIGNLYYAAQYGARGAALTMLIGSIIYFLMEFYWVERHIIRFPVSIKMGLPLVGVAVMSFVVFALRGFQPVMAVIAGFIVYLSFLWVTNVVTDFENLMMRFFKSNWRGIG